MNNLKYNKKPFGSIESLARSLGYTEEELIHISKNVSSYYRITNKFEKDDGSFRITYDTHPKLKELHRKIKKNIFYNITYPDYLIGGLPQKDYKLNCEIHSGKKVIICEDVTKFYDSISSIEVCKMWKSFFNFPYEVAEILTELTTYNGFVAQGAVPSSYISNLIFWDCEPQFVEWLESQDIVYTRYIDDISISSNNYLTKEKMSYIISQIVNMFGRKGVRINRSKHNQASSSGKMQLHRVNINYKKPTLPKTVRSSIRSLVYKTEILFKSDKKSPEYINSYNSVLGKVNHLTRFHKTEGNKLKNRMKQIKPLKSC